MASDLIAAILPVIVTLLLGYFAGWHHDFDIKRAAVLIQMVMSYALPITLFSGLLAMPRQQIAAQWSLALTIAVAMVAAYGIVLFLSRIIFKRDIMTASLQSLMVSTPSTFVGVPVLGHLFGNEHTILIAVVGMVFSLILLPTTMILLAAGRAKTSPASENASELSGEIIHALRQPLVWAPLLAVVFVLTGLQLPLPLRQSFLLLGNTTGGVALFGCGIYLYSIRITVGTEAALLVAGRNIIVPAASLVAMLLLSFEANAVREIVVTLALPVVVVGLALAVRYGVAEQQMASILFFSTVLSFLTIAAFFWVSP